MILRILRMSVQRRKREVAACGFQLRSKRLCLDLLDRRHFMNRLLAAFLVVITTMVVSTHARASQCAPADITGDDLVGVDDLLAVIDNWGGPTNNPADIAPPGGDGSVSVDDLLLVIDNWGPTGFASGAFPALWIN